MPRCPRAFDLSSAGRHRLSTTIAGNPSRAAQRGDNFEHPDTRRSARTGRCVGVATVASPAAVPCLSRGIGFAPETIALLAAICRAFPSPRRERKMTAYLIALALIGLVMIAAADAIS